MNSNTNTNTSNKVKISSKILVIDKPIGLSSFDVIRKLKKILHLNRKDKIGHFGTLDPFASGILLVGIGSSLKLNQFVHKLFTKTYLAEGTLGIKTASGDNTNPIIEEDFNHQKLSKISALSIEELNQLYSSLVGDYLQRPPLYSAQKYNGLPLYKWARMTTVEGSTTTEDDIKEIMESKKEQKRYIKKLRVVNYSFPKITFEVEVSSGTYVRTLFEDMAQKLNTIGTLTALRRTAIAHIDLSNAVKLEEISESSLSFKQSCEQSCEQDDSRIFLKEYSKAINSDDLFFLPKIYLQDRKAYLYKNGNQVKIDNEMLCDLVDNSDGFIWVYENDDSNLLGLGKRENTLDYYTTIIPVVCL
ncbi:MAG: hypothetical protein HQK49_05115 [Oligoflexia bacterium]|nr:hypothetical protein [Oligoflexia bacterium]